MLDGTVFDMVTNTNFVRVQTFLGISSTHETLYKNVKTVYRTA